MKKLIRRDCPYFEIYELNITDPNLDMKWGFVARTYVKFMFLSSGLNA